MEWKVFFGLNFHIITFWTTVGKKCGLKNIGTHFKEFIKAIMLKSHTSWSYQLKIPSFMVQKMIQILFKMHLKGENDFNMRKL